MKKQKLFIPLRSMKKFFLFSSIYFLTITAWSQEDSTEIDSLIALELQEEFSFKSTLIDSTIDYSNDYLINFCSKNGITYDATCTNLELYREIQGWLGVRYRYGGKDKKGVDCAGLVSHLCNKTYGTNLAGSAGNHFEKCIEISQEDLEEGDLVFFKINKTFISHVGLYLGDGNFVHATVSGGVMLNNLSQDYYKKYYFTSGRLKNNNITSNGN